MLYSMQELQLFKEQRDEAIEIAKSNCLRLKHFGEYGVPTFIERMPQYTTSILAQSDTNTGNHDIKCDLLTAEQQDIEFVNRMKKLICTLPEAYRNIFISVYINGKAIRSFHRGDIYTILRRGYLKLAIMDSTIDYTSEKEMNYRNLKESHNTKKTMTIKRMRAKLLELQSLYLSNEINIETDHLNQYSLINRSADQHKFDFYAAMISWINELHAIECYSGMNPKEALMKFIMDADWKYLDTTDRRNLNKGILALAYLDPDINYSYEELKYDVTEYQESIKFLTALKIFQFRLPI